VMDGMIDYPRRWVLTELYPKLANELIRGHSRCACDDNSVRDLLQQDGLMTCIAPRMPPAQMQQSCGSIQRSPCGPQLGKPVSRSMIVPQVGPSRPAIQKEKAPSAKFG
jgi:hypothetical protein